MQRTKGIHTYLNRSAFAGLCLVTLAACATPGVQPTPNDYVEIENPGITMSNNAPATIWVPRSYVESGPPRGGELAKRSYNAIMGTGTPAANKTAQAGAAPTGIAAVGGKPAHIVATFGLIAAVDNEKIFFNLGQEAGIVKGQKLKVYRGGTVVEGLGLAPGENVATVEVVGFVGTRGGYGIVKQGGPVQTNDLIGAE